MRGQILRVSVVAGVSAFAVAAGVSQDAAKPMDAAEARMVAAVDAGTAADQVLLERIVNINSGTMNLAGVVKVKDILEPQLQELGFTTRWVPMQAADGRAGDLVAEHACAAGAGKCGKKLLLIGHMDTVFEPTSPFQTYQIVPGTNGLQATGPGVADMKGGLVIMLRALRAMRVAGVLDRAEIRVVLSGDEEHFGSPTTVSRHDLVEAAKRSDVALEFENAARTGGIAEGQDSVRIGRRSSIEWRMETTGRSGHSSQIFNESMGFGAVYELVRIINAFRTDLREPGLTFNVGMVVGGQSAKFDETGAVGTATGKTNIVPPAALAKGDIRTLNEEQTARVKAKMEAIVREHLPRTEARIEFAQGYPAMGVSAGSEALLAKLQEVNVALGFGPEAVGDPAQGGAGDIAFAAPFVPGLVGVGAMGSGAHAPGETVYLDSLPRQAKRMAVLMYELSKAD